MVAKRALTFSKGGIHPEENKSLTAGLPVEVLPWPKEVRLFLKQHTGVPCKPRVKKKDRVFEGELIGSVTDRVGANLHASVSGAVKGMRRVMHPSGEKAPAVIVATDLEAAPRSYTSQDWAQLSKEKLISLIEDAGVVGLGGGGFPAAVKLALKPDVHVDTLILNGAECEPYLSSDHRIMLEHAREVVEGAKIILSVLGIRRCVIGIEENKGDAIEALRASIARNPDGDSFSIDVQPLEVKYPQGAADQMMESITGRVRPSGLRSSAIGIIVQNVYTAKAIHDAVVLKKPFYERIVTVSGRGIARPANLKVKVGTPIGDLVDHLGGTTPDLSKIIVGGPLTGYAVSSLGVPITKTTSGILFLTKEETDLQSHYPCIRCGFCLEACPMGLEPNNIGIYVEAGRGDETEQFGLKDCYECGSCAFVCPSRRPLVQFVRLAKKAVREKRQ
jgi:electron transport complex protein RnfC